MNTRALIVVGSGIAVLLAGVIVALVLVLGQLQSQASQDAYEDCMARYGFIADAPAPAMSEGEAAEYIDALGEAASRCGR